MKIWKNWICVNVTKHFEEKIMARKKTVFEALNRNLQEYRKDYEGFIRRSEYIEKREYEDHCREEKDLEILNSYGAF